MRELPASAEIPDDDLAGVPPSGGFQAIDMVATTKQADEAFFIRLDFWLRIVLAPIWLPLWAIWTLWLHAKLFWYLHGDEQTAWQRCTKIWLASDSVHSDMVGADLDPTFQHSLCEYFAGYHPGSIKLLRRQLSNRNPQLAAYAFKCLIRHPHISLRDIPDKVLRRKEEIKSFRYCFITGRPLGKWIAEYFEIQEATEARNKMRGSTISTVARIRTDHAA